MRNHKHAILICVAAMLRRLREAQLDRARRRAADRRQLAGVPGLSNSASYRRTLDFVAARECGSQGKSNTAGLERKYAKVTDQLSAQIRDAAGKIASQSQLKLVLTREGIGYGGVDITSDVEKALNITEKATPTPGI